MYDGVSTNIDSNVTTVADDVAWLCICKAYAISNASHSTGAVRKTDTEVCIYTHNESGAVSAKLGDSLVDRSEQLHVIPSTYDIEDGLKLPGTKVLMKAASKMPIVKETLKRNDLKGAMIENCGMPEEHIYHGVDEIPDQASYYSIIVVKEDHHD